jgi:lysozyme family protein
MAIFNNIKQLTLQKEGGLSRDTRDSASRYPSPYTYQGQTGWHTNKGITYRVFESASDKFGFPNTAENFLTMPDEIWTKIAKGLFWDDLKLDNLKSDGVAFQLFSWHWGAGYGWYSKMQEFLNSKGISWDKKSSTLSKALNDLITKQGERQTIADLDTLQIAYYKSLNQPTYTKGWINRVKDTTSLAYRYVVDFAKKNESKIMNYGLMGVGLIVVTGLSYWYYKKIKK